jgi:hypothetical protein
VAASATMDAEPIGLREMADRMVNPTPPAPPATGARIESDPKALADECEVMAQAMASQATAQTGLRAMGSHADPAYLYGRASNALALAAARIRADIAAPAVTVVLGDAPASPATTQPELAPEAAPSAKGKAK